jgi:hypothetical protein
MPRARGNDPESSNVKREREKDERLGVRLDPELARLVKDKAKSRGWSLGSVIRALLRLWSEEDVVSAEDVGQESERSPRRGKKG